MAFQCPTPLAIAGGWLGRHIFGATTLINTHEVLQALMDAGFQVADARQTRTRRGTDPIHARHMIRLRPMREWLAKYEQAWNDRLDRLDDYLKELQQQGERL